MPFNLEGFITTENFVGAIDGLPIRQHHYASNDTSAAIETAGYFNALRDGAFIRAGDVLIVSGDRDGTPFCSIYIFASVPAIGGGDVTITEGKAVTQNVLQVVTARVTALGTASTAYVASPIAGTIKSIYAVSDDANGSAESTIDVKVGGDTVGTLAFSDAYVAGTSVNAGTVAANTLTAGQSIELDNQGEGNGTGAVTITMVIEPA